MEDSTSVTPEAFASLSPRILPACWKRVGEATVFEGSFHVEKDPTTLRRSTMTIPVPIMHVGIRNRMRLHSGSSLNPIFYLRPCYRTVEWIISSAVHTAYRGEVWRFTFPFLHRMWASTIVFPASNNRMLRLQCRDGANAHASSTFKEVQLSRCLPRDFSAIRSVPRIVR